MYQSENNVRTIILHYHLFKNAGTSLDHVLKENFGAAWVTKEFRNANGPQGNTPQLEAWIKENPEAVVFSSHTIMGPLPQIEGVRIVSVMLLRDPIDRIKSAYRFESKQQIDGFGPMLARHTDFEGYVRVRLTMGHDRQCRNFQTHRLASLVPGPEPELERALEGLKQLAIVGLVSDFSDTLKRLTAAIDAEYPDFSWVEERRNVSKVEGSKAGENSSIQALLEQANSDDITVLEAAMRMLEKASNLDS